MNLKLKRITLMYTILLLALVGIVAAACADWNTTGDCGDNDCLWESDSWGNRCVDKKCYQIDTQNACASASVDGKSCDWKPGRTYKDCWPRSCRNSFSGTNESACVNNTAELGCSWSNSCYGVGGVSNSLCVNNTVKSACLNQTGCGWGSCGLISCSGYADESTCTPNADYSGKNCTWDSGISQCKTPRCYDNKNKTYCENVTRLDCTWNSNTNTCGSTTCYTFSFTNETGCVNNTINSSCYWYDNSYCYQKYCGSYAADETTCTDQKECTWSVREGSGSCIESSCYNFDGWNGGNDSACVNNTVGLSCNWKNRTSGNTTDGWCVKNVDDVACSNHTIQYNCLHTNYCWWNYNSTTFRGTCSDPAWGTGDHEADTIGNDWNPKCFIFNKNSTECNAIFGCNYTGGKCQEYTGTANTYEDNITAYGIRCSHINESRLCNSLAALNNCCIWTNSSCAENRVSRECFDNLDTTPNGEESCEDAANRNSCDRLAGSPWFMPCKWDNTTSVEKCAFDTENIFGNTSTNIIKIENERNCLAAGGKWLLESYCSGNVSVPIGRCEYRFDSEDNCDKTCFGCERKDSAGITVNSTNAKRACEESVLGFCEFKADTTAPNTIGFCRAKKEFEIGTAGNCDKNCGACTYKGDPNSTDDTKTPKFYCERSKANNESGGCKWVEDNVTDTEGVCYKKGEKTCADKCDRCGTQNDCSNIGRTNVANNTGSCKWEGDEDDGDCIANVGEDVEICWDAIDNDGNQLIDCADPGCYTDSHCGFVSGDCFGWNRNDTCLDAGCEWVTDNWGEWCDFNGSQCWKSDHNVTDCTNRNGCTWDNGTGSGYCERDWSVAETCFSKNVTDCTGSCEWTSDSWCNTSSGGGTDWCNQYGGWCDHTDYKPKNCWTYSDTASCDAVKGCGWKKDSFGGQTQCEINWTSNCWQNNDSATCTTATSCNWRTEGSFSWCENRMSTCWSQNTENDCLLVNATSANQSFRIKACSWRNTVNGTPYCEPSCFNSTLTYDQNTCQAQSGCLWKEDFGWCEEKQSEDCFGANTTGNKTACNAQSGCRWNDPGWCSPKDGFNVGGGTGGGGGGSSGSECYKYDGNESLCLDKNAINASCGWTTEPNPYCDVDWSIDCWQYQTQAACGTTNCYWHNDVFGSYCTNVMDQCWLNDTLQGDAAACNANAKCNATSYGGCEPSCYQQTAEAGCEGVTGCNWVSGWCNPAGMHDIFKGMEAGKPIIIGVDTCGAGSTETNQTSVDVCGTGMRDMGDSYGFGAEVFNFINSSVCNKEKVTLANDTQVVGNGNETVKLVVYLDTDSKTTGNCALSHNNTEKGFEFRLIYDSTWNANKSITEETFTAYKCDNTNWKLTDIKINAWKRVMCSDIHGPMLAVEKADLSKFASLYNTTADLRVAVATIGNTGNLTNPIDVVTPSYTSPGSVDFEISDAFAYGADTAKYDDILRSGFIAYEDCYNDVDDDYDGKVDCSDWDCQFSPKCTSTGVNDVGFTDTESPVVKGVRIEEYPDSVLITYDTNKPANGTLSFYRNDSECNTLNKTINDIGINKTNIRTYKLAHTAEVDHFNLGFNLTPNSSYYYKLNLCDNTGKCAVSQCTSFRTALLTECGYCNFVTRIKAPTNWTVAYDVNQSGVYDHVQGAVCGENSGMKSNYTDGRRVDVKINNTDGLFFEFLNATLTKSALNDRVRTIDNASDIIATSTVVGLPANTRDKIVNNLHPEICRVKIPFTGTCNKLFHCDDDGGNCVERTEQAILINSTDCVWELPFCEFSSYREETSTTTTTTSSSSSSTTGGSSGSGGGGGGARGACTNACTYTGQIWCVDDTTYTECETKYGCLQWSVSKETTAGQTCKLNALLGGKKSMADAAAKNQAELEQQKQLKGTPNTKLIIQILILGLIAAAFIVWKQRKMDKKGTYLNRNNTTEAYGSQRKK